MEEDDELDESPSEELEQEPVQEAGGGENTIDQSAGQAEGPHSFEQARQQISSKPDAPPRTPSSKQAGSQTVRKAGQAEQTVLDAKKQDAARVIEAALFLSNKPLPYPELALIAKTSVKKAKDLAEKLSKEYAERHTSIELVCDGQQATMQVKGDFLAPVAQLSKNIEMSRKATRMLALVAKKGKLLQSELKKYFRGDIYAYIAELKQLGYVSSEKHGNTRLLKTTEKFRENFQLGSSGQAMLEAAAAKTESAADAQDAVTKEVAEKTENLVMEVK